jgi:hypothetical protein
MLACGCELKAGQPVTIEQLEKHWDHTIDVLVFWELLLGANRPDDDLKAKVAEARLAVGEFVNKQKMAQLAKIEAAGGNQSVMEVFKALGMI